MEVNISPVFYVLAVLIFIAIVVVIVVRIFINKNSVSNKGNMNHSSIQQAGRDINIYAGSANNQQQKDIETQCGQHFGVNILFVDDEPIDSENFRLKKILSGLGYTNVHKIEDVSSINQSEIVNAKIIFVDITGVGKSLGFHDEGIGLAVRLKKTYNGKTVAIYSSTESHNIFASGWEELDGRFSKNSDPQLFVDFIEQHAK